MLFKRILWVVSLGLTGIPTVQAQPLYFQDVLKSAFAHHPELANARLQVNLRQLDQEQLNGMLDTQMQASAGVSDEIVPTVNPFAPNGTTIAYISAQVIKPLEDGSSLTGTINYNRVELAYPSSVPVTFQSTINPTYEHQIDLIYRYPLWRGAGNPSYQYQKEAASYEATATALRMQMLKEGLASQAIAMYFQLAFNDLSLKLSADAVLRAKELLRYQKKREIFGLIEKADRLQADALLAARKLQLVQAVAARDASQTALNRLMFQDGDVHLKPKLTAVEARHVAADAMFAQAAENRPVFRMLAAQYAAAEARLSQAQDGEQQQLDVVGQLGTRALSGNGLTAFGQGFTLDERYIGVRLEFNDVLNHSSSRALIQKSALQLELIGWERKKAEEELKTELANIYRLIRSSAVTLKASQGLVKAEQKKFKAEMVRYREGRSNTATVTQFEGDLRAAELRLLMQKVSLQQAKYQQALAMGVLPLAENKQDVVTKAEVTR